MAIATTSITELKAPACLAAPNPAQLVPLDACPDRFVAYASVCVSACLSSVPFCVDCVVLFLPCCFVFSIFFHLQTSRSSPYLDKEVPLNDLSRVYTYSYLTAEPTQGYLRKPLEPRPPKSPQFHRPAGILNSTAMLSAQCLTLCPLQTTTTSSATRPRRCPVKGCRQWWTTCSLPRRGPSRLQ